MNPKILDILNRHFGHSRFRGLQEEVITRLLNSPEGHSLVLMPTGAGKSLCYQVPGLVLEGGTVVVSPLIALMKDQVDSLRKKGIRADYINSTVPAADRKKRLEAFVYGDLRFLYVTPERFQKHDFLFKLKRANISLFAVDEAHCISQWGHDFRPDYSRLGEVRKQLGNPLTVALTATATPAVQKDITASLGFAGDGMKIFHQGIKRPNLRLEAVECFSDDEKTEQIRSVCRKAGGSGIIYFALIKTLERYSELLHIMKIPHLVYHGKLPPKARRSVQDEFMTSNLPILATNAFGMGIVSYMYVLQKYITYIIQSVYFYILPFA